MIAGIGFDLVDMAGFREQLDDTASVFVTGTFTSGERRDARSRPSKDQARHLAVRFAAKEAFIKAWSTANWGHAPAMSRVDMRHIEVVSDAQGRPALRLHDRVAQLVATLPGFRAHVSLSHDGGVAGAVVVIETTEMTTT